MPENRSPAHRPPVDQRGFGASTGGIMAISVTVTIGDVWASCESDANYSPDILDDLTTQAAATAIAAAKAVMA